MSSNVHMLLHFLYSRFGGTYSKSVAMFKSSLHHQGIGQSASSSQYLAVTSRPMPGIVRRLQLQANSLPARATAGSGDTQHKDSSNETYLQ